MPINEFFSNPYIWLGSILTILILICIWLIVKFFTYTKNRTHTDYMTEEEIDEHEQWLESATNKAKNKGRL